jgi:pimeloyl-ACP methyl ester carboxylesterase
MLPRLTSPSPIAYPQRMKILALSAFLGIASLAAAAPKLEVGVINGAAFRIDIPDNWNGGLVVYCHGYNQSPVKFKEDAANPLIKVFTEEGYAFAQSGYATGGWAVQEAAVDTESLRRYFVTKYGTPKETYLTGHSMGGFLTMMLMENYPTVYDAAMPMCGPLASTESFQGRGAFDSLVLFNYYFPGILPDPTKIPKDFVGGTADRPLLAKISAALEASPEKAAALRHQNNLKSNKDLAGTLGFLVYLVKELNERSGGNPFDNRNIIYSGTLDDNALNSAIPRYAADPQAVAYLRANYTPTGKISKPMLAIHTSYDPLVPVTIPAAYSTLVELAGTSNLFVQQFVKHDGHCAILPEEMSRGFSELRAWKKNGTRPIGGELK